MPESRGLTIPAGIDFRRVYRFELLADFCRLREAEREALEQLLRREGAHYRDCVFSPDGIVLSWHIFEGCLRQLRRRSVGFCEGGAN